MVRLKQRVAGIVKRKVLHTINTYGPRFTVQLQLAPAQLIIKLTL